MKSNGNTYNFNLVNAVVRAIVQDQSGKIPSGILEPIVDHGVTIVSPDTVLEDGFNGKSIARRGIRDFVIAASTPVDIDEIFLK